jgi:hypothetical protein
VLRALVAALAGAVLLSPAAAAHPPGPALGVAIEGLRTVQVSYNTASGFSELEADAVSRQLAGSDAVTVAFVAPEALLLAGPDATAREVANHVGRDGAYVVATGRRLGAWSTDLDADEVSALVADARAATAGQPPSVVVMDLVGRLDDLERESKADAAPGWLWPAVAVAALASLVVVAVAIRRRSPAARAASAGER